MVGGDSVFCGGGCKFQGTFPLVCPVGVPDERSEPLEVLPAWVLLTGTLPISTAASCVTAKKKKEKMRASLSGDPGSIIALC